MCVILDVFLEYILCYCNESPLASGTAEGSRTTAGTNAAAFLLYFGIYSISAGLLHTLQKVPISRDQLLHQQNHYNFKR